MLLSLPEAAERLGVVERRVRQRIAAGSLRAEKVGGRWLIEAADLAAAPQRPVGRPLSVHSAWALIGVAEALAAENPEPDLGEHSVEDRREDKGADLLTDAGPVVRYRSRARLSALFEQFHQSVALDPDDEARARRAANDLRNLLRNRAERALYSASPADLDDLRSDDRLSLSGLSRPESGIASGGLVEGYVRHDQRGSLVDDYLLVDARESDANVFLHVVDEQDPRRWASLSEAVDSWLVMAADLAEHRRPREEARALELLRESAEKVAG